MGCSQMRGQMNKAIILGICMLVLIVGCTPTNEQYLNCYDLCKEYGLGSNECPLNSSVKNDVHTSCRSRYGMPYS